MIIVDEGIENKIDVNEKLSGDIRIRGSKNTISLPQDLENIDILIEGDNNNIKINENVKIFKILNVTITGNKCKLIIGKDTSVYESKILINENNNSVEIGEDCMISESVKILASDSHSIVLQKNNKCINYHKTGIYIGNHVWLGMNSLILKDTQIGDNSVVAAGAVVTHKEKKKNVVLGGNPAKVIKKEISWERKQPEKTEIAEQVEIADVEVNGKILCYLDNGIDKQEEIQKISGWALVEGVDSSNSEIYFQIKDNINTKVYKAQSSYRTDIAKCYGQQYINSGFNIIFQKTLNLNKTKEVNIIIKNEEQLYKSKIWIQEGINDEKYRYSSSSV